MQNLQSLGHAAGMYQRDPREIRCALDVVQQRRDAVPALTLNGVDYFDADEIVKAIGWLAEHDAREAAKKAAQGANVNG